MWEQGEEVNSDDDDEDEVEVLDDIERDDLESEGMLIGTCSSL